MGRSEPKEKKKLCELWVSAVKSIFHLGSGFTTGTLDTSNAQKCKSQKS